MNSLAKMIGMVRKEMQDHQGLGRPDGWNNFRREGFNEAYDELDKWTVSKEKISKAINDEWYEQLGKGLNRGQACDLFADAIIKALPTILTKERE